ncbi:hypothetical protein NX784_27305 [Massilia pinisoli]|uniref:Quinol:cytochrome c oxidoreductase quinone-binding subunit 2 n=1 Tax=Massilia pinisoli TaxID=1772194 RepID=A0ABT1ZZI0_9BURK|nr:hypothetical protein [Massilia pinisoli]MCS0585295.1 hypothetical protein [Massilia pinisoli]
MTTKKLALPALVLLAAALAGWRLDLRALLACYLAAWWFVAGALLGGLANVWLHQLTGGAWGETIRGPLLRAARWLPLACLLFLPVLLGAPLLYPWQHGVAGEPDATFRHLWLSPAFFTGRSVGYLLLWSVLAIVETRARTRSAARAAMCLLAYGFSVSLAAVDWIMSLQPEWYSSVFGWLAGTGQMLTGLALAVLLIDRGAARGRLPDLGNLMMMYVLTWAYLAYVQFLIIWAADLPHEIAWYLRRGAPGWQAVAWVLVAGHFAGPLCILLSRHAKAAPALMGVLAGALLAAHLLDCWWLVLPSVPLVTHHWLWLAPLVAAGFGLLAWTALAVGRKEGAHA